VGKATDKVTRFGHDNQPVFGAGRDIDAKVWQSVIRQLTAMGLMVVNHDAHGALTLDESARAVFKKERAITFRRDPVRKSAEVRRALSVSADLDPQARDIFEALRAKRAELAKAQGVPPYVVFHDSTLKAMALARPGSLDAMGILPGVGAAKLERYGEAFLAVLAGV